MLKKIVTISCCAAGLCLSQLGLVHAQQPVRQGLRRTGQAVTQGTRAAVQGTAEAARRTGQAARNVIRGDTQNRQRTEAMTDTNPTFEGTPPENPNAGVTNTDGSTQGINSQQQPYQSGYRGADQQYQQGTTQAPNTWNDGRVYTLRHDGQGREFICVNGQRVYFDNASSNYQSNQNQSNNSQVPPSPEAYQSNRPLPNGQMMTPTLEDENPQAGQSGSSQSNESNENNRQSSESEDSSKQSDSFENDNSPSSSSAERDQDSSSSDKDSPDSADQAKEEQDNEESDNDAQ